MTTAPVINAVARRNQREIEAGAVLDVIEREREAGRSHTIALVRIRTASSQAPPILKIAQEIPYGDDATHLTVLRDGKMSNPMLCHKITGLMSGSGNVDRDERSAHDHVN